MPALLELLRAHRRGTDKADKRWRDLRLNFTREYVSALISDICTLLHALSPAQPAAAAMDLQPSSTLQTASGKSALAASGEGDKKRDLQGSQQEAVAGKHWRMPDQASGACQIRLLMSRFKLSILALMQHVLKSVCTWQWQALFACQAALLHQSLAKALIGAI